MRAVEHHGDDGVPGAVAFHVATTSPVSGSNVGALVIDARVGRDTETTNRDASDGATAAGFPRASSA